MLEKIFRLKKNTPLAASDIAQVNMEIDRYDRIFQGSRGYGFVDFDVSTKQVYWHGGFWSHLGYDDKDIYKSDESTKNISAGRSFIKLLHPDDRAKFVVSILRLIKKLSSEDLIFRIVKKDGRYVWIELRLDALCNDYGKVSHLSGVVIDVTALKETEYALKVSEARHERIIQSSNDGIWEWATQWRKKKGGAPDEYERVWSNKQFSSRCWEMIGFSEDDDEVKEGMSAWTRLMHPEDFKHFEKVLSDHLHKRSTIYEVEYRIRNKQGEWRWILARGLMGCDEQGRPMTISGTNMDITALKNAEKRVLRAKEDAEKASQAKSEFLSSMSHELRTPLNAILGFAQLLELNDNLTPEQQSNTREIKAAGKHLLELVGDVLDLAKIEAGHLTLTLEQVPLSRALNECIALLKAQIDKRNLNLEIHFEDVENILVSADPIRLKQIFLNLMGNAIKYNKPNGDICLECAKYSQDKVKITVKDTGVGISKERQAELFQPFNRLGAERSGIEGSGIGLVITKQLVEQMSGEISYNSEHGVGSEFWVEFPMVNNTTPSNASPQQTFIDKSIPELKIKQAKQILYVEDNPASLKLMQKMLVHFPVLNLTAVGLGVQGLYLARSNIPDLIILDLNLPGISGYEIVEILKQDPRTQHIPVVALSANALFSDIEKGKEAGFDHYLTKPLNLSELIAVFNDLLESAESF